MDEDMRTLLKKVRLIRRLKKNGGRAEEVAEDMMKEDNEWMKEVRKKMNEVGIEGTGEVFRILTSKVKKQ